MDIKNQELGGIDKPIKGIVHVLLFHSYSIYFFAIILGVVCDIIFPFRIFHGIVYEYIGIAFIAIGSILVYWAQYITRSVGKSVSVERDVNFFLHGPYKYTRNPTNLGLTLAVLGLGLIMSSFFSIVFVSAAYIISKIFFIKKQDSILEERYGNTFDDYRKKVKDWL